MTHIRGDITKVYEVLKKGYSQPIVQTTHGYTITTGAIAPGVHAYDLPAITSGYLGYIKIISVTCNNNTSLHEIIAQRINPDGYTWTFFLSYFYINGEWDTGDIVVGETNTLRIYIDNNAAGNVNFTVNVYWVESPIV